MRKRKNVEDEADRIQALTGVPGYPPGMSCPTAIPRPVRLRPARVRRPAPSLVRATLARNDARALERGTLVAVGLESLSRIVVANRSVVWCRRYGGLAGLFRKDRGPSKELGRALCDEVRERFGCEGFLTTDELPRYGIGRKSRQTILTATDASSGDCVVVYAYPADLARQIDEYLHTRLTSML